jgi:hypothetical protein
MLGTTGKYLRTVARDSFGGEGDIGGHVQTGVGVDQLNLQWIIASQK